MLTRGDYRLAGFHRFLGYATFAAGVGLMLASVTALYWFGTVIGLPGVSAVMVALSIEVMAAGLASSATTARRGDGRVDWTAWLGFAFFVSVAAYANVMHVLAYLNPGQAPAWFHPGLYTGAACVFAAACPLGGTWGVHRFGWLRAHGADATWVDDTVTDAAPVAVEAPAEPVAAPEPPAAPAQPPATATATTRAPRPPRTDVEDVAWTGYQALRNDHDNPHAGHLRVWLTEHGHTPPSDATLRRWISRFRDRHDAQRLHAVG